jgi:hypothetical protein
LLYCVTAYVESGTTMSTYESRAADVRREMRDEDQWETVPAP